MGLNICLVLTFLMISAASFCEAVFTQSFSLEFTRIDSFSLIENAAEEETCSVNSSNVVRAKACFMACFMAFLALLMTFLKFL